MNYQKRVKIPLHKYHMTLLVWFTAQVFVTMRQSNHENNNTSAVGLHNVSHSGVQTGKFHVEIILNFLCTFFPNMPHKSLYVINRISHLCYILSLLINLLTKLRMTLAKARGISS